MHFVIDQRRFTVSIASRPLLLGGEPCRAKLDRVRRIIWLSDQLPRHERRRELFHELRHAWVDAHGRARDDEHDADQAAAMMDELLEQYQQQGGDAVLESLNPEAQRTPRSVSALAMTIVTAECGHCRAPTAIGSIATDPPAWNADLAAWTVARGILCEACDRVTVWTEVCTPEGMPLGALVAYPPPRVLGGAEAGEWIEKHRQTCRVA